MKNSVSDPDNPIPVVMTTYNRPKALIRALESLGRTEGYIHLFIQDDASDAETRDIINDWDWTRYFALLALGYVPHGEHGGEPNRARRRALYKVFDGEWDQGFEFVVTIESDVIVHPTWLSRLMSFLDQCSQFPGNLALNGVTLATISPYRSTAYSGDEQLHPYGTWARRKATGGVCHVITREWYEQGKRDGGWMAWERRIEKDGRVDWPEGCGGWDHMMSVDATRGGIYFAVMIPSLVDHQPGDEGGTSGSSLAFDRAIDFIGEQ